MDWIRQEKLRNWLIFGLVVLNILTVSIIWMQTARRNAPPSGEQAARPRESVTLLQKVIGLNDQQTARAESIMTARRERSKASNDRAAELKRRLAEELSKDEPDTALARTIATEIGGLLSDVELIRFHHFRSLMAICTPEQKEKLKPIVLEVFGRKPPKEDPGEINRPPGTGRGRPPVGPGPGEPGPGGTRHEGQPEPGRPRPPEDEIAGPPSVEEKLTRYSERLNLSGDQVEKVREILLQSREEGERIGPGPAKEERKKAEDERIMKVLRPDQQREFEKMQSRRREQRP